MWRRYFPRRDRRDVFVVVANLARAAPKPGFVSCHPSVDFSHSFLEDN